MPGRPDIVIPNLNLAIFLDGCFFHLCPKHGRIPDSNRDYWEPKLLGNVRRDARSRRALRRMGFAVWRFWEHDFASLSSTERSVAVLASRFGRAVHEQ